MRRRPADARGLIVQTCRNRLNMAQACSQLLSRYLLSPGSEFDFFVTSHNTGLLDQSKS